MSTNLDRRAIELVELALDLSEEKVPGFLAAACGDNVELRDKIDAMLAEIDRTSDGDSTDHGGRQTSSTRLEVGKRLLGRYRIVSVAGTGGMGEVYRALDQRLEREVAIKVLSLSSSTDEAMQARFRREVKAVAALSHPHIVTLHDVTEDGELQFAVMEFVDGQTLRDLMKNPIPWRRAIQWAIPIADALAAAHQRDLMHRDIKPTNVMITPSGDTKVLDFGLARQTKPCESVQKLTVSSMSPGTIPYMSPEQVEGRDLDCSTDVFSLGTLLYEMLTGKHPFLTGTAFLTMQQVVGLEPVKLQTIVADIPQQLSLLVESMMRKSAGSRPNANDITTELRSLLHDGSTSTGIIVAETPATDSQLSEADTSHNLGQPTIAVLPLQVLSSDDSHRMYGDAISQEVIVDLAKLHWLLVISRGSSFQFRDSDVDLGQASEILGARYFLTGSINCLGGRAIVSVELSHAKEGRIVWAERFDTAIDELLALRQSIVEQIVMSIETRIQRTEAEQAIRLGTENLDAWSAYHRGLWHMYRFTAKDNKVAQEMFELALRADSRFARAQGGLSFTHFQDAFLGFSTHRESSRQLARMHAERGYDIDPFDPFVNLTMGRADWLDGNVEGANAWLDRSLEISPNFAFALYNKGLIEAILNNGVASEEMLARTMEISPIDPLNYAIYCTRGFSHIVLGDYSTASDWCEKAIRQPNAHIHIYAVAAVAAQLAGNHDLAKQHMAFVHRTNPHYGLLDMLGCFQFRDNQTVSDLARAFSALGSNDGGT